MIQANIDNHTFEFFSSKTHNQDCIQVKGNVFHIIKNNKSYIAQIIEAKLKEKCFIIRLEGKDYTIFLKDQFDQLLEKMGMSHSVSNKVSHIIAPMPGLVLQVPVSPGDEVQKGSPLIILEAMKMENIIKSPGKGFVKNILVKEGDPVEKGQILIEME